jgi:hypothetical protein
MSMHICYVDNHEAGVCCYLVITYRNPVTSFTAVLLPFVTYLLTLLVFHIRCVKRWRNRREHRICFLVCVCLTASVV